MKDLTAFQRDLLYVIANHDRPYGLQIKRHLGEYYETEINHGRLYPNLEVVIEEGLVHKGSIDDRTNSYELTREGRREMENRRRWENERLPNQVPAHASE